MPANESAVLAHIRVELLNLRQRDMAKALGVSTRVYSNIELGQRPLKDRERTVLDTFFREKGIDMTEQVANYPGPTQVYAKILVTKQFSSVSEEQMREVLKHLEAIREAVNSLGAGWEVVCEKIM
ncbi:MAG: helix-turn-helix domain-containing protein [Candidatus Zambryskibacteria bacterium]|nr:helix-turn-helix domain-containing protein [Candidatus Zambryskibacteria bacterium]